ncbi:uncharacterized protein B0J16DRAFT_351742, partial [Fusarium flagelliforme]|uniref:uncharacterized protein n=1 Tax=Fusarium flagelliforme TaxID=2675880 RepID=UPI001E8DFAA4
MSYSTQLSAYIDGWLNTFTESADQSCDKPILNWNQMPTPPSSEITRSPKRPRCQDAQEEETPRPRARSQYDCVRDDVFKDQKPTGPSFRFALPTRPFSNAPSLPPSSSASGTSRSSSPVKRSTLGLLSKPIHFIAMKRSHLPKHIHKTYDAIFSIVNNIGFIPSAVRQQLEDNDEDVLDQWFFNGEGEDVLKEFTELRAIQAEAAAVQVEEASEGTWNLEVHGPLLKLAFKPFSRLRRKLLTHASISKPFIPSTSESSYYPTTKTKMIDWGISIFPPETIAEHISRMINNLPVSQRSINQTIYGPVRNTPIALPIEIKIASGSLEEARGQLGLWIAAWYTRMNALKSCNEGMIAMPMIIVMEHEWKLLFAVDRRESIDIVESLAMGNTMDLQGLYKIVAVLRVLGRWMEAEYLEWLERWLGLSES